MRGATRVSSAAARLAAPLLLAAAALAFGARGLQEAPRDYPEGARVEQHLQMVADRNEDIDVVGIADDDFEASVQVFFVRKGRVVGRKGFIVDKVEELSPGGLVDRILEELYGDDPPAGVGRANATSSFRSSCGRKAISRLMNWSN